MKVMVVRYMTSCNLRDRHKHLLFPTSGQESDIIFTIMIIIIIIIIIAISFLLFSLLS